MVHRLILICAVALAAACTSPVGPREPVKFQSATRPAGSSSFPNWTEPPDVAMKDMATAPPAVTSVNPPQRARAAPRSSTCSWGTRA